jgi:hypothetical protein
MKWKAFFCLVCSIASALARQGAVETRDGKIYEGAVRFFPNSVLVVSSARNLMVRIPTTNVLELTFRKDEEAALLPDPWEVTSDNGNLPISWKKEDIGNGKMRGNAEFIGSVVRLYSGGRSVVEAEDACHFVYKPVTGDSEIVTRVLQVQRAGARARAGIMMREGLEPNAKNVSLVLTAGEGGQFTWRDQAGAVAQMSTRPDLAAPYYIKLRRDGDTFTGFKSVNGRNWTMLYQVSVPMHQEIYVGLAAAGFGEEFVSRAMLDNFREAPSLPVTACVPTVQLLSGSTLAGRIVALNDSGLFLSGGPGREPIQTRMIANVLFQWLPSRFSNILNSGKKGVLLMNGEFVEGDFMGIENGKLVLSSVLFGIKFYRMDDELIALVLQRPSKAKTQVEVRTTDGSAWIGTGMEFADNEIVLKDSALGKHAIPIYELAGVRWNGP